MASSHRDLQAWKLADAVRRSVIILVRKPKVRADFDFCSQAQRSARSACRNICEGFYRFGHPEFAHFVNIARASLGELLDTVDDARLEGYLTPGEADSLEDQVQHAIAASNSLFTFLNSTPTPPRGARRQRLPTNPR